MCSVCPLAIIKGRVVTRIHDAPRSFLWEAAGNFMYNYSKNNYIQFCTRDNFLSTF